MGHQGDNSRPLRVLVEAEGPNIALPAADEGVRFVPVPPGYVLPASRRPASPSRQPNGSRASEAASPWLMRLDPASAAALATSFRTAAHGGKELVS